MEADLILKNGIIQTMNGNQIASAVAICGSEILYVGDDKGAENFAGEVTEIMDLAGKYVTPGFIDGHTHEVMNMIDEGEMFFFDTLPAELDAYIDGFRSFIEEHTEKEIYYGCNMDINTFPEGFVTNGWLNEICPNKPACITDMSQHCFLMNAKALEFVGLDCHTPTPDGANIYKHPNGELTGFVADAFSIMEKLPPLDHSPEKYRKAFLKYQTICHSYGITGIDIAGAAIDSQEAWKTLHEMEQTGELKLRINCAIMDVIDNEINADLAHQYVKALNNGQKYNSDFQVVSQAKALLDGVIEGKSACLLEPYAPEAEEAPDYKGSLYVNPEDLNQFVKIINENGYQVQLHAIGDSAVRTALDAFEYAGSVNNTKDNRNMIAHVCLICDEDIQRMADLKVIGTMQPLWWYHEPNFALLEKQYLGSERFKKEYRIRDMMNAGIKITGSIDYPIQPDFRPLAGIQTGATQGSPYPGEWDDPKFDRNPDQTVTPLQMLECYTVNGAFEMKMENWIGTIEVGKKADMVVLEKNILECDVKSIAETKVCYTIMNGNIVYKS